MTTWRRRALGALALTGLLIFFAFAAVNCGGDDDGDGNGAASVEGLGSDIEEIRATAREEGQVNLINWAGYVEKDWVTPFETETGCKVNSKVGATSDEMVTLMKTGSYDGVSASGDATLRLIAGGDVAEVDLDLIENYDTVDDVPYGVPHGRGANLLMFRTDVVKPAPTSWSVVWEATSPYKGKITAYDSPIYIADAAVYLKATQPDLNITDPYELDDAQFKAAVDLLKQQNANIGEYWSDAAKEIQAFTNKDTVVGTTWQYQVNQLTGAKVPVQGILPKEGSTGWSDTWMIASKSKNPNCMYLWMNYIISPEANAKATEYFGEAPVNAEACNLTKDKNHCETFHAQDEEYFSNVAYWKTPIKDCGDDRGEVCKDYSEWTAAWTEIKG
jgi:putative spermidine/putrescine transport system substrate-binding protein